MRPAHPDDFDELTRIWKAAVEATHDFVTPEEIAGYEGRMRTEFLPAVEIIISTGEGGEPVGFIGLDGEKIEMLFVDPVAHGRGVGRELIESVAETRSSLSVDVNEENSGAVAFYRKVGFVPSGRSELDQDGRPHPLIHFSLRR